jgi:hypothetical protein
MLSYLVSMSLQFLFSVFIVTTSKSLGAGREGVGRERERQLLLADEYMLPSSNLFFHVASFSSFPHSYV